MFHVVFLEIVFKIESEMKCPWNLPESTTLSAFLHTCLSLQDVLLVCIFNFSHDSKVIESLTYQTLFKFRANEMVQRIFSFDHATEVGWN